MPFWVATGALTILFLVLVVLLIARPILQPGVLILGAFILWVLWLTGLIKTSIELWGSGGVNDNCMLYVDGKPWTGQIQSLAWLEQESICRYPRSGIRIYSLWETGSEMLTSVVGC